VKDKPKVFLLIAGLIFINTAGFFLRYFERDTFFILFGFRFHFSIFLFFLLIIKDIDLSSVKEMFIHPSKQKFIPLLIIALIPLLFIPADMYLLQKYKISEQDYFFELGLSSIIDYPVYLVWNAPQLFMFFIFMITISRQPGLVKSSLIIFFLFLFEIFPLDILSESGSLTTINYLTIVEFILIVILAGLLITGIKNIYLFTFILFTFLWGTVLFFGSSSAMPVNILLASQYESWYGLINSGKHFEFSGYLRIAYILILLIASVFVVRQKK